MPGYTRTSDRARGLAALTALEDSERLFCYPQEAADVMGCDFKTVYSALERGEIPHTRIGQRYHIPVAWLRRQVDGLDRPQPAGTAA